MRPEILMMLNNKTLLPDCDTVQFSARICYHVKSNPKYETHRVFFFMNLISA